MENDFTKTIASLDDAGFDQLEQAVQEQREARRQKLDLSEIKPGMTRDQRARVQAEIARALKGAGLRG